MATLGQKKKILILSIFILSSILLFRTLFILWDSLLPDFTVYYNSVKILFENKNPYMVTDRFTQINYLPSALFLLYPITLFNFVDSSRIWLSFSIISFFGSLFLLYKIKKTSFFIISILLLASVISFPFKFTLGMGQINLFILFLLSLFLYLFQKKRFGGAGIILSVATIIKIFPALFLFIPIFLGKWKTIIWFLIILLLALILINTQLTIYYFKEIFLPLFMSSYGEIYYNQSITGFMSRLNAPFFLIIILRLFFLIYSIYFVFKNKSNLLLSFSVLLVLVLLINNFTWQHHLVFLLIPYYFMFSGKITTSTVFLLIFSYILIALNIKDSSVYQTTIYGNLILSHGFLGILIVWALLVFRGEKIISIK